MQNPVAETERFGDFLLHFLGHASFTEMLRAIHEVYARNTAALPQEIINLLNERMKVPEKVNAVLKPDDSDDEFHGFEQTERL